MPHRKPGTPLDVELAGEVQGLLFPKGSPVCSWCCMGVKNRMASVLGGDYYDFVALEDGCQVVLIGDVTGHGLHASVVMALVYGYLHRAMAESCDPQAAVSKLNGFLRTFAVRSQRLDHFFSTTLFFGVIDPRSLVMHYVNAGHPAGLLKRAGNLTRLAATGHPIGYFDHPELRLQTVKLQPGDRLLLYTDGLIDSLNAVGDLFGPERLENLCAGMNCGHLDLLETLFAELSSHLGDVSPVDDCTAIVIDIHGLVA